MPYLLVLEDFLVVVDRSAGNAGRLQARNPVPARPALHDVLYDGDQGAAVADAIGHGLEALVQRELRPLRGGAEARPLAVVSSADNHVAVGSRKYLVGKQVGVRVAPALRDLA